MKPAPFGYAVAEDRKHAIEILRREGADARPLAGGQSLVAMMNFRIARPSFLVDLNRCQDLSYVKVDGDRLRIGAMVRQRDAELDPVVRKACPLIQIALSTAGSVPIRSRGTVGGSIANGYPVADLIAVAITLEAEMIVANAVGERSVSAEDFFIDGMVTAVEPGDLLTETVFPVAGGASRFAYQKRGNHAGSEASVIVCTAAEMDGDRFVSLRIVGAGMAGRPMRFRSVEEAVMSNVPDLDDAYRADLETREFVEVNAETEFAEDQVESLIRAVVNELRLSAGERP
jgi:carbon-monoxide dehydrogenase medium subunit